MERELTQVEADVLRSISLYKKGALLEQLKGEFSSEALMCLRGLASEKWLNTSLICDPQSDSAFDLIHNPNTPYTLTDKSKLWLANDERTRRVTKQELRKAQIQGGVFSILVSVLASLILSWLNAK